MAAHRFVKANGINIHIAEMGSGPTVVLLHGFPESWYTWRVHLKALAEAGFHAVAPDLRGFGLTECPRDSSGQLQLSVLHAVDDLAGLIHALGGKPVFLVARDAGALAGWTICRMKPELVRGFVSIGIPPLGSFQVPVHVEGLYMNRFAEPGRAEKDFARFDTATVLKNIYTLFSRSELQIAAPDEEVLDMVKPTEVPPAWFSEEFLRVQTELYNSSGFEAPLCFTYRNLDKNFNLLAGTPVSTPCLYLMGEDDYVGKAPDIEHYLKNGEMHKDVPNLKGIVFLPGGHFVEQDSPEEVTARLISFFKELST